MLITLGSPLILKPGQRHAPRVVRLAGEAAARETPSVPLAMQASVLLHVDDAHQPRPPVALRASERADIAVDLGLASGLPIPAPAISLGTGSPLTPKARAIDVSVVGPITLVNDGALTVQTDQGDVTVMLRADTRISQGMPGAVTDLVPGSFVSLVKPPNGPARSVQVYPVGVPTPAVGLTALAGPEQGLVLLQGSMIGVYPGSITVSAGGQLFQVPLNAGTRILKTAETTLARVAVGRQVAIRATQQAPQEPATASALLLTDAPPSIAR